GQPCFRLLSIARFFFLSAAEALVFFWSWFFCFDFGDLSPMISNMLVFVVGGLLLGESAGPKKFPTARLE
ncbi:MAG: hypothetical protein P1U87_23300, partial [Verrucomicrobiales bacterium]|nr:hypothetical protein [Verrucomicrobiales bacterium]